MISLPGAEAWIIQTTAGADDYGSPNEPALMAVCTTEHRAAQLASRLWGHTGPGLPEGVTITKIPLNELIPDD